MTHTSLQSVFKRLIKKVALVAAFTFLFASMTETAHAVSSWAPTLLVNTEAFQTLDSGDGSSNIELRFGNNVNRRIYWDITAARFVFTQPVLIQGNLTATGAVSFKKVFSGANLRVDNAADIWGTLGVSGATVLKSTLRVNNNTKVIGNLSGTSLQVDRDAQFYGNIAASGTIKTRSNITINSEAEAADAVLTFGNATANQTLTFGNTNQRFAFSKGLSVRGNLSGTTLRVDGNADIWGALGVSGATVFNRLSYTWPGSQSPNTFLKTDGAGVLSWSAVTVGNGSGDILSLHPEYPNTVYFQSGATTVGTLTYSASGATDNYYRWATTRSALQDYWLSVRVQVPKNFSHFETASGIQLRLRTSTTTKEDNYATLRLIDTTGAAVAVTSNANMTGSIVNTWALKTIGNVTAGTYTPLGYITLLIKMAAKSNGFTDLGNINLNWTTTTP